tara:strand:+ start:659 stop:1018 length:360 start_codon:yes stop_codon:yes gene_type:complete
MGDLTANFSRSEFKCKCGNCDFDTVDIETLTVLQGVADHFEASVTINSACRCPEHNKAVGGSKNSYHVKARAADITVFGVKPSDVHFYLDHTYPDIYGLGKYDFFTHIDTRSNKARWKG